MVRNPAAWTQYRKLVDNRSIAADRALNQFAARYNMARQLTAVHFASISASTAAAYTAALRVGLAYSALEGLASALKLGKAGIPIKNEALALSLKHPRHRIFHEFLIGGESEVNKHLLSEIRNFLGSQSIDLRPISARIRHLMFHGVFTAHGSGIARSKSLTADINQLADQTLFSVDARFTRWVNDQA